MRQVDVGRAIGASGSAVSRVELGRVRSLSVVRLARHAAAVGLKPTIRMYPLVRRLLDQPQVALLERFRARLHPTWTWRTEVPMPLPGDLRSGDCVIEIPQCRVLVEAFTRLSNWQAQTANAARKARDLGANRLIILVADTHANRRALAEADAIRDGSFPIRTRAALAALGAGTDPGGDAIVVL